MKSFRLLALGLLIAACSPSAHALVGGPWDHLITNQFSRQNSNGIYEASITMQDGSGFVRFISSNDRANLTDANESQNTTTADIFSFSQTTTNTTTSLAARSNTVVFFQGNAYFGSVYGSVNLRSRAVQGAGGGLSSVVDQVESSVTGLASSIDAIVYLNGFSESMNISFTGTVSESVPEVRFEADGEVLFFTRPDIQIEQVPIIGANDDDDVPILYTIRLANPPGGPLTPDDQRPIRLFGGRISLQTDFTDPALAGALGTGN